jgi:hypothetical protein
MKAIVLAALLIVSPATTSGPAFDTASVKPNRTREGIRGHSFPGDRFEARNVPPRRFDVSATVGADGQRSVAQKQLMLRTLLAERFALVAHFQTEDRPGYALTVARADGALDPRLRQADAEFDPQGLPGMFQLRLEQPKDPPSLDSAGRGTGLKLLSTTAAVSVLVIDHVEKPTPD